MAGDGYDLNLLVPLRALLEEANVTRAGQRVQMGQSSMSSALSRLRLVFNDELLVRVGRDYELTPLARLLLPQVQETLPLIERVLAGERAFDPLSSRRSFTLMMTDYGAMRLRGPIAAVLEQAPEMEVDVVPLPERPMESERDLITHDFVITVAGIGIEGQSHDLILDEYVCLIDPGNPALVDGTLSFDAFVALPQAVAQFGRLHFTPADRRLRELGVDRSEPRVTTASFLPLPSIVAGTDLVAVVPRVLAERLGPVNGVIGVEAPFGRVPIDLKLWWHESHDGDPSHVWFRDRLIEAVEAAALR
ncbi:LysR family transcriptional regulator [Microbacterium sp. B2969]|uniref:LysR family transcriptional regulator n=1 Tax=Microbacterium alkaliflavum TaxID=3248839 RepID=A0ABW7Q987_9MICO